MKFGQKRQQCGRSIAVVLTKEKLVKATKETAGAVSKISGNKIRSLGLRSIPEALRLVPGMTVLKGISGRYLISYHGIEDTFDHSIKLLVNGLHAFPIGLSQILRDSLPFTIEDIDRIEVMRGPNNATYGSGAFETVINIILSQPQDYSTVSLSSSKNVSGTEQSRYHLHAKGQWPARIR